MGCLCSLCRSQLRNDQDRLQTQLADSKHRSTELSAKLEQERMGKEDSVRTQSLEGLQPSSGLQPHFAESPAAAGPLLGAVCCLFLKPSLLHVAVGDARVAVHAAKREQSTGTDA